MSDIHHTQESSRISTTETLIDGASPQDHAGKPADPNAYPSVIPPTHTNRTLVVCFDGTGDQFDNDNSNIVKFVSLLKKDDRTQQMVYYQTGIGTYTSSPKTTVNPWSAKIQKTIDLMFATSLNAHVQGGYQFLMQNYAAGDKICIFGFSRGAYTARSLAGMLHKIGLLPPYNAEQIPFAYQMYLNTEKSGWAQSNEFKRTFSINVDIEFVGVWDTVASVGLIPDIRLPFTTSNAVVKTFRHAVSLDERRAKFKANLWNTPDDKDANLGLPLPPPSEEVPPTPTEATSTAVEAKPGSGFTQRKGKSQVKRPVGVKQADKGNDDLSVLERTHSHHRGGERKPTDIKEVWFAGCHCDVGGGSVNNETRHSLARIPLRWMVREIFKANTGILFEADRLFEIGMHPASLYPEVKPRSTTLQDVGNRKIRKHSVKEIPTRPHAVLTYLNEEPALEDVCDPKPLGVDDFLGEDEEELMDALSPAYDQLEKWSWWFMEKIPLTLLWQEESGWVSCRGRNLEAPRYIPHQDKGLRFHRSVRLRMEAEFEDEALKKKYKESDGKYEPMPDYKAEPMWVDLDPKA
ncbi:hypothetical protein D9611_013959 [Ephemerocybe angulata]|uniref:T6SS Phospholipase effector Tle1-like catalytic domain-containing protein n=1 Tax=Ephemerocybe angulata TaxID=980116 RepID=A0A8H5ERF7_9AGAR|nr:hypothetical protein D9611_013959 [Tulosesus angulatus]